MHDGFERHVFDVACRIDKIHRIDTGKNAQTTKLGRIRRRGNATQVLPDGDAGGRVLQMVLRRFLLKAGILRGQRRRHGPVVVQPADGVGERAVGAVKAGTVFQQAIADTHFVHSQHHIAIGSCVEVVDAEVTKTVLVADRYPARLAVATDHLALVVQNHPTGIVPKAPGGRKA